VGVCLNKRSFDETAGKWGQEPPFYCLFCLIKAYLISIRQIPIKTTLIQECQSLPHARGGVSMTDTKKPQKVRSSPRSWGCFLKGLKSVSLHDIDAEGRAVETGGVLLQDYSI